MAGRIDTKLKKLEIELPQAPAALANYVPSVTSGNLVFVSGQLCRDGGGIRYTGKVGEELSVEDGRAAARLCALNVLSVLRDACAGDLDRVRRVVRLGVFVNSAADMTQQPAVANGASDLMVEVFDDAGRHARAAVGCNALPMDSAVEVEGVFAIE